MEEPAIDRKGIFEVAVFLLLIVPSMIMSSPALGKEQPGFAIFATLAIFRDIGLTCLVVFFLWRNGEPLSGLGWKVFRVKEEAALGAALFLPVLWGEALIEWVFEWFGLSLGMSRVPQFLTAKGTGEIIFSCVLVVVAAVAEETLFRGYLLLRLKPLTGSTWAAVLISSALFSIGHGYEGAAGVGTVAILGVLLACLYVWRKSLVAPVVLHFLIDFFPLVLLPLFRLH
ncbi:MAG: type II CAAX endopeptidase family protein [Syntrophobacteraceae bacterium]|nr:type II CAAX endopeptidase family protein [Syntrophobacteraceae bacterium]